MPIAILFVKSSMSLLVHCLHVCGHFVFTVVSYAHMTFSFSNIVLHIGCGLLLLHVIHIEFIYSWFVHGCVR